VDQINLQKGTFGTGKTVVALQFLRPWGDGAWEVFVLDPDGADAPRTVVEEGRGMSPDYGGRYLVGDRAGGGHTYFDAFYTTKGHNGTGLRCGIAQRMVQKHLWSLLLFSWLRGGGSGRRSAYLCLTVRSK
jgi:hypothetical protein